MYFLQKIFKKKKKYTERPSIKTPVSAASPAVAEGEKQGVVPRKIIAGVIRAPRVSEKASLLAKENKFMFLVNPKANKFEIARALRVLYGVDIESVWVTNTHGKERRRGRQIGWKPGFKKAIVKVKNGQTIEIQ